MRLYIVPWLAVLTLVTSSFGCTSSDKTRGGQATSTETIPGLLIQPKDAAKIGYRLAWASPISLLDNQRITSATVLGDIIIVIEDPQNTVTALRAADGEFLWKTELDSRLDKLFAPTRDGKQIFIHSTTRIFTIEARTGKTTAVANLDSPVSAPAVYSPQTRLAIFSGVNGLCFAHNIDDRFSRWQYKLPNRTNTSAVLAEQDVFFVGADGTYAMLESATGKPLWRNHTLGSVTATPSVQDSEIIVASHDGKLYAINRTTGKDTWQFLDAKQPLTASPIVLGRLIIQPLLPNAGAIAIDSINGKELWRSNMNATPVLTRDQDLLLYSTNSLIAIDLNDGKARVQVPTKPLYTVTQIDETGAVLLVTPQGQMTRLNPI